MKLWRVGSLITLVLGLGTYAFAHHSAAGVDQTKTVTLEGTVKEFKWANPHSYLEVEVQNSNGKVEIWDLEMQPPFILVPAGWKSSTLKFGDKIKFTARPMKNGDPGGLFVSVTLPDGKTLTQTAPRGGGAAPAAPATAAPPRGQ